MKKDNHTHEFTRQKLTGLEIAIVGVSCRFPNSETVESFWKNCLEGTDCISRFSDETLAKNGVSKQHYASQNYVNAKGVIDNPLTFDADFFDYNKREAEFLEPQIRKLHECGFEALGSAGIVPSEYKGAVGCYLASSAQLGWQMAAYDECEQDGASLFSAFNLVEKDFAATRLAYKLGLTGPAIAIQTACSSSLTAIHLASRALLLGECQTALVAAATLVTPSQQGYLHQDGMITSPDGTCRPFDEMANGTVGGEGVGAIVLQPLKIALEQGRPILALIKGSALNNDGSRKVGYTAPSIDGQFEAIRGALAMSKVEAESISYIEAHGTATKLGDPIEITALNKVFANVPQHSIAIGSVKSIIGHLDSAAGMAGLIKTALMLKHKKLCANRYFTNPNPKTKLSSSPFYVNTDSKDWDSATVRRAGVSSFGIGGTNAHVILEEYVCEPHDDQASDAVKLLPLSAKSEWSLGEMENRLIAWLASNPNKLADVAHTLQNGREHFGYRSVLVCSDDRATYSTADFVRGRCESANKRVVFLYPGQGSQYQTMGLGLYLRESVFKEQVEHCLSLLNDEKREQIRNYLMEPESSNPFPAEIIQLAIFIVEYATTRLMESKGIQPDILLGHSLGEYVAATISGVFALKDALFLVGRRAQLMEKMSPGAMLSVPLSKEQVVELLAGSLEIAAVNGKESTVLSGSIEDIENLKSYLQLQGIHSRQLKTTHAFHSKTIDEIQDEYEQALQTVAFNSVNIPILSNLSGDWHDNNEIRKPAYWLSHQRDKVDFLGCLETLSSQQHLVFIEVGPGNTLASCVQKFFKQKLDQQIHIANMLRHPNLPEGDITYFYSQIAKLWCTVGLGNWQVPSSQSGRLIHLPVYAFAEKEFTKIRDRLVKGRTPQIKSPDIKGNILYRPVWYRSSCDDIKKMAHEGQVYVLTTNRGANSNRALVDNVLSGQNIIFVEEVDKLPSLNLTGCCSFVLMPNAEDFVGDPIAHYLEWLACIKNILSSKSLAASRFILLTPQIENVLGYEITDGAISLLKGLIQSINHEHQEHYGYQIDISFDELAQDNSTQSLLRRLVSSDINHRVAIRHNQIWLPEFKALPNKSVETHQQYNGLHERCLVLISGGLGGIALQLSQSLAQHYKARIVLASRTAIPDRSQWANIKENKQQLALIKQIECVEKIEQLGGEVVLRQLDVTDKPKLFDTLQYLENNYGAINMVIHSAGSDAGALIMQPDISSHRKIMTAKVEGAMNLISYFEEKPLNSMVLCSSLLSYCGAPGQSAYVAANAFLDGIADRRDLKFKIYSLAWDRWLEVGMASRNMKIDASTEGLTNQQGEAVFLQALSQATQQRLLVSVIPIEERVNTLDREKANILAETKNEIVSKNISIKQVISEEVQHQLGLSEIDEHCSFFALGATSLDIVQINERLKQRIYHDIPISMMFTYSTVSKLENAVASKLNNIQENEAALLQHRTSASQLAKQRMKNKRVKKSANYAV